MRAATPTRVPVILISGVDEEAIAAATIGLQWDLPNAAVVHHEIDPERELLVRTISDATGMIEHTEVDIEHACTDCAIREGVIPTLERLAATGNWESLIAQLPVTAETTQVCRVLGMDPHEHPRLRVAASVVALHAENILPDLQGDDLLVERELPVREDDRRGVAETASAMVEYADLIIALGDLASIDRELLLTLAQPDVRIADAEASLDPRELEAGIHRYDHLEDWVQVVRRDPLPTHNHEQTWVLDFASDRPFHPDRLRHNIQIIAGGASRSRGCFWLPSRPSQICQWDGAGGMLSIGYGDNWDGHPQLTRIVVVGTDDTRSALKAALNDSLLTDAEIQARGRYWEVGSDGFERWLGPIRSLNLKAS
ncbi:MAG: GTP-binding protein [Arachnia sp.]